MLSLANFAFASSTRTACCSATTKPISTRLFGVNTGPGHFKDAFNEYVLHNKTEAVNPAGEGTKVAGFYLREIPAGGSTTIRLRLSDGGNGPSGFDGFDDVFTGRIGQANVFYAALQ